MKYILLLLSSILTINISTIAQHTQPSRTSPLVIEVNPPGSTKRSSGNGKELPADANFQFHYRFFIYVEHERKYYSGHFDLDAKTGTILSTRDDALEGFIIRTQNNKIYAYTDAGGEKIVSEMNAGDNAVNAKFNNNFNTISANFNAGKRTSRTIKIPEDTTYTLSSINIFTDKGTAEILYTPIRFEVHTSGSIDPMTGLGIMYDAHSKKHYLITNTISPEFKASIVGVRKIKHSVNGKQYSKLSGMMDFSTDKLPGNMQKNVQKYKESNNMSDHVDIADIYAGGDIQLQINDANDKIRELDETLMKPLTIDQKSALMEEKRIIENAQITLRRHLNEIRQKTPAYWKSNMNAFLEIKAKHATELINN